MIDNCNVLDTHRLIAVWRRHQNTKFRPLCVRLRIPGYRARYTSSSLVTDS